ncbi:MAG: hypothetical protein ABIR96_06530 [Bdellovibrionota bacterium]
MATDPSASCEYGKSDPCLIVTEISKKTPIDFSREEITILPEADIDKLLKWECFEPSLQQLIRDQGLPSEQSLGAGVFRPIEGKSIEDLIQSEYDTSSSLSYPYDNPTVNDRASREDMRALRLRNDIEMKIQTRFYEKQDLLHPSTPELKNILTHLSNTGLGIECLRKFSVPAPKNSQNLGPDFNEWLSQVVSEKDFSEVVQDAVIVEKPGDHR